ncbi:MAG TPA: hypothetical protein PLJ58_00350 [bacterium]|nr:hypothetical protein [bacterium]
MNMTKTTKIIIPLLLAFVLLAAASAPVFADSVGRNKGSMMMGHKKMKFNKVEMEAKMAKMKEQHAAMDKALTENNYNAWVLAVKAMNPESPILAKINATNFSKLVEIHNLRKQLDVKMTELDIKEVMGMMHGKGFAGHWQK